MKPRIRVPAICIFVSAFPLAESSGGLTVASGSPDGEIAADILLPVSSRVTGDAPAADLAPPAAGKPFELDIPALLKHNSQNIAAWMVQS